MVRRVINCDPMVNRRSRAKRMTDVCATVLNSGLSGITGINFVRPNLKKDACVAAKSKATPLRCCTRYQFGLTLRATMRCHMLPANVIPVQAKKEYRKDPPLMHRNIRKIPKAVNRAARPISV